MRKWAFFITALGTLFAVSMCCSTAPRYLLSARENTDIGAVPLWRICRELYEGMPGEKVRELIAESKMEKQHWAAAGDGSSFEWWRWNIPTKDPETGAVRAYASLDIELRENKLFIFTCYAYADKELLGHRCIYSKNECPHFQEISVQEPAQTPNPNKTPLWLK